MLLVGVESYLARDQFDISWGECDCSVSHDLRFDGAQASCSTGLNKAVQYHIQEVRYLQTVTHISDWSISAEEYGFALFVFCLIFISFFFLRLFNFYKMACSIKVYVDFYMGKYIGSIFPIITLLKWILQLICYSTNISYHYLYRKMQIDQSSWFQVGAILHRYIYKMAWCGKYRSPDLYTFWS